MRHLRISASCLIAAAFLMDGTTAFCKQLQAGQIGRIDSLMNAVYRRGQFTGAILVASH